MADLSGRLAQQMRRLRARESLGAQASSLGRAYQTINRFRTRHACDEAYRQFSVELKTWEAGPLGGVHHEQVQFRFERTWFIAYRIEITEQQQEAGLMARVLDLTLRFGQPLSLSESMEREVMSAAVAAGYRPPTRPHGGDSSQGHGRPPQTTAELPLPWLTPPDTQH